MKLTLDHGHDNGHEEARYGTKGHGHAPRMKLSLFEKTQ